MGALKENTRREAEEIRQLLRQQMDVLAESCKSATAPAVAEATMAMLAIADYLESSAKHIG